VSFCESNPLGFVCAGISHTGQLQQLPISIGQKALCVSNATAADGAALRVTLPHTVQHHRHYSPGYKNVLFPGRSNADESRCCTDGIHIGDKTPCTGVAPQAAEYSGGMRLNESLPERSTARDKVILGKLLKYTRFFCNVLHSI
jgi:hypothetical protein